MTNATKEKLAVGIAIGFVLFAATSISYKKGYVRGTNAKLDSSIEVIANDAWETTQGNRLVDLARRLDDLELKISELSASLVQ